VRQAERALERLERVEKPFEPWRLQLSLTPRSRSGDVVVRAGPFRDIASLGDFERAVGGIAGVQEAYVRSFAGDRALLELRLAGELDLVGELRRALAWELRVVDSGPGELEIGLGS